MTALASSPTAHASAPYDVGQDRQTHRPPEEESEDHQRDPRAHAPLIEFDLSICDRRHVPSSVLVGAVNVNNIYIANGAAPGCQGSFLRPDRWGCRPDSEGLAERIRAALEIREPPPGGQFGKDAASATASPHGDKISVQPIFVSPSRSTAAGQANA